jgi:hypothetical protein
MPTETSMVSGERKAGGEKVRERDMVKGRK